MVSAYSLEKRENSIAEYMKDPSHCIYCDKIIEVYDGYQANKIRDRKFCSNICQIEYRKITPENKSCSICHKIFPNTDEYFRFENNHKLGLRFECIDCVKYAEVNGKECSKCKNIFPATREYFYRHFKGKYGLRSDCRFCQEDYKRKLKQSRAEKGFIPTKKFTGKICTAPECENFLPSWAELFCSSRCRSVVYRNLYIARWKNGEEKGYINDKDPHIHGIIRDYLINKYDRKCSLCGWGEINKFSEKLPLEIHHEDGHKENCIEENLTVLCPNCHSLTNNFRGLNKKNRISSIS